MFTAFGAGVFAGMWVMAGCAMVASFKNDQRIYVGVC